MPNIIKGTTPTIEYKFRYVDVANITEAYITLKCAGLTIEKSLEGATVGENTLSWTLTQEETLALDGKATLMLNWKTEDGTRGASSRTCFKIDENDINEVI